MTLRSVVLLVPAAPAKHFALRSTTGYARGSGEALLLPPSVCGAGPSYKLFQIPFVFGTTSVDTMGLQPPCASFRC